jgi:phosphomannomutase/phosphoglucomutase
VIDCGNAAACLSAPDIFPAVGIETYELYCDVDGDFPNHHPDPTEDHNLLELVKQMQSGDYDFGVAFDGDADRVVAVDEKGSIIRSDILMALFVPEVIKNPRDSIVFDVKCSQALEDTIIKYGGQPVMWKTGHSLIKDKMKELNVDFAGEMSGHIFFADDYYGYDDAIYVSLRLAQLLSRTDKSLSELTEEIPVYYSTPEMRLECLDDEEKFKISRKADKYFIENYDCITLDGVRIKFNDGWGLVRASNTQPVIVCRFEARSIERMQEIQYEILEKLSEFGEITLEHR